MQRPPKLDPESGHQFDQCRDDCDDANCPICMGGLASCVVCCQGEATLAKICPGPRECVICPFCSADIVLKRQGNYDLCYDVGSTGRHVCGGVARYFTVDIDKLRARALGDGGYVAANAPGYVKAAAQAYVEASKREARGMGSATPGAGRAHDTARIAFAQSLRKWANELDHA